MKDKSPISIANEALRLTKLAHIDMPEKRRKSRQRKIFIRCLLNLKFTSKWIDALKSGEYNIVTAHRKHLFIKPFRSYMSIKWSKKQKAKVILDTYRFIINKGDKFMPVITNKHGIKIASFKIDDTCYGHLTLNYEEINHREGELVMSFRCDKIDKVVASAAFSFEEREKDNWICRIGCIQGIKRDTEYSSKIIQKLLHGFRPKSLIAFVVQEFSRHLGIKTVYGVSDAIHSYRGKHAIHLPWRSGIEFDYNAFWVECGGKLTNDGWYKLPLIPVRKDILDVKSNKRAQYKRRYSLCDDISLSIANASKAQNKMI